MWPRAQPHTAYHIAVQRAVLAAVTVTRPGSSLDVSQHNTSDGHGADNTPFSKHRLTKLAAYIYNQGICEDMRNTSKRSCCFTL